jgi:hypothetical protein
MRSRSAAFPVRKGQHAVGRQKWLMEMLGRLSTHAEQVSSGRPRAYLLATIARAKPTKASRSAGGANRAARSFGER